MSESFSAKIITTLAAASLVCINIANSAVVDIVDCATLIGQGANVSQADCEALPLYASLISEVGVGNYAWEKIDLTTEDGYQLTMVHITGDENGAGSPSSPDKSPLLLVHGLNTDGLIWFERNDPFKTALPMQLFDAGYDVYIANLRGTEGSRGHDTLDPDDLDDLVNGAAAYWDFDASDSGK